jgi:hypothetical protein
MSLRRLLDAFRPCFSSRTFATFVALTADQAPTGADRRAISCSPLVEPTPEQIQAIRLAWADAAA